MFSITISDKKSLALWVLLFFIFSYVFILNAWVGDDAFITFRTLDNFVNGYGLRWNIVERVQSFTNPLWLLILSPIYWLVREIYFTSIFFNFLFSGLAIFVCISYFHKFLDRFIFLVLLISSKAFTDYTSSGLENSLNYFLLAFFYTRFVKLIQGNLINLAFRDFLTFFLVISLGFVSRQYNSIILDTSNLYIESLTER
jgi:arabinofuranosyltransferase